MPSLRSVALVFVSLLAVNTFSWGQGATTSLRGVVSDRTGAAISRAKVTISNAERAFERSTTTGAEGTYEFLQLAVGTYSLTVDMAGFRKYEQKEIQLLVNTPASASVTLDVGTTAETVEGTAAGTLVNTSDASLGNAFNERQIKDLPMEGRNVPDLLTLQAGVTYTGNRSDIDKDKDTRSGAVNGSRSDQSNVTLDGTDGSGERLCFHLGFARDAGFGSGIPRHD